MEFSSEQTHELTICIDNIRTLKYLHDNNIDVKTFGLWANREYYGGFSHNEDGYDVFFKGLDLLFDKVNDEQDPEQIRLSWEEWDKLIELKGINYVNDHFLDFKKCECDIDGCTGEIQFSENEVSVHFDWAPTYFSGFIDFLIQLKNEVHFCLNNMEESYG